MSHLFYCSYEYVCDDAGFTDLYNVSREIHQCDIFFIKAWVGFFTM